MSASEINLRLGLPFEFVKLYVLHTLKRHFVRSSILMTFDELQGGNCERAPLGCLDDMAAN